MSDEKRILEVIKSEERHKRYNQAIQNKTRRKILIFLSEKERSILEISESMLLGQRELEYQLSFLKYGACIEEIGIEGEKQYKITPEGRVIVDLMKKKQKMISSS